MLEAVRFSRPQTRTSDAKAKPPGPATGIRNFISPVMVYLNGAPGPTQILAPAYAGPQGQYDGLDQVNLDHQSPGFTVPAGREVYVGSQRGWFRFERRAILCSIGGGKLNPTAARAL